MCGNMGLCEISVPSSSQICSGPKTILKNLSKKRVTFMTCLCLVLIIFNLKTNWYHVDVWLTPANRIVEHKENTCFLMCVPAVVCNNVRYQSEWGQTRSSTELLNFSQTGQILSNSKSSVQVIDDSMCRICFLTRLCEF